LGYVVARNSTESSNTGEHPSDYAPIIIGLGTCNGRILGAGFGVVLAETYGKWGDIYITYRFENKSP
jgi:hypothetical protein